jgi:DNA-binding PadR family transcriptional regulator
METKLTTTELAVLGLLADGEHSGYDLHAKAARGVGYIWTPAKSQIYKVLPRLVKRGLVSRRDVAQAARPDKQLYRMTNAGRAALREWIETVEAATEGTRDAVLLKIFFGALVGAEVTAHHVEALRDHDASLLVEWEEIDRQPVVDPIRRSTLKYGLARARATIEWAEASLAELRKLSPKPRARAGR